MTILFILLIISLIGFLIYLEYISKKSIPISYKKINTNYLTTGFYRPENNNFITEIIEITGLNDSECISLFKNLDYIYNSHTLKELEYMSTIYKENNFKIIIDNFIILKRKDNEFFLKYPEHKPEYYNM